MCVPLVIRRGHPQSPFPGIYIIIMGCRCTEMLCADICMYFGGFYDLALCWIAFCPILLLISGCKRAFGVFFWRVKTVFVEPE
jgi:hypothetical protein